MTIIHQNPEPVLTHYDDGKQNYKSHEISAILYDSKTKEMTDFSISDITGYGETKLEALKEFKKGLDMFFHVLKSFEEDVSEAIKKEESGESTSCIEIDCCGNEIK